MVKNITKEMEQLVLNGGMLECKDIHDGTCLAYAFIRFFRTFKNVYK